MTSNNSNNQQQKQQKSVLDRIVDRQENFDNFMGHFSSPEMFGTELYNLHSMDASEEATRLLADCIEANWIIFGEGQSNEKKNAVCMNNGNDVSLAELINKKKQQDGEKMQTSNANQNDDDDEDVSED